MSGALPLLSRPLSSGKQDQTCPCCKKHSENPRLLGCLHSVCTPCLNKVGRLHYMWTPCIYSEVDNTVCGNLVFKRWLTTFYLYAIIARSHSKHVLSGLHFLKVSVNYTRRAFDSVRNFKICVMVIIVIVIVVVIVTGGKQSQILILLYDIITISEISCWKVSWISNIPRWRMYFAC